MITNLNTEVDSDAAVGTSFHNTTIIASIKQLEIILGKATYKDNTGKDKVNLEWVRKTQSGDIFTVYDYKEYRRIKRDELINWHIGANNKIISEQALSEIKGVKS